MSSSVNIPLAVSKISGRLPTKKFLICNIRFAIAQYERTLNAFVGIKTDKVIHYQQRYREKLQCIHLVVVINKHVSTQLAVVKNP